ncbi:hypothetical protein HDV00_007884 [Rhizophlyctis rosea]|nr:hypothetical protein HDV00_007884 [Rhizophlyctis rosea]
MSNTANVNMSDVLIIGGGPTGLFAAMELARHGTRNIRIIDPKPTTCEYSKALAVHARSLEMLSHHEGLFEEMLAKGTTVRRFRVLSGTGGVNGTIEFGAAIPNTKHTYILGINQPVTEPTLANYLSNRYGIQVEWNAEFVSLQRADDHVTVNVKNNKTNETSTITCRFLIGCDGGHSPVRKAFNVDFPGHSTPLVAMNVDCHITTNDPELQAGETAYIVPTNGIGFLPSERGTGRVRILGPVTNIPFPSHGQAIPPPTLEDVQKLVDERAPFLKAKVHDPHWLSYFTSQQRKVPEEGYRPHPRVFLAGDATHVHAPVGGWGMNTGFQDVANLSWKVSTYLRGSPQPLDCPLLNSYQKERSPVGDRLVQVTDPSRMASLPTPILNFIGSIALPTMLQIPAFRTVLGSTASMILISYPSSPLNIQPKKGKTWVSQIIDHVTNAPVLAAGSRAPDGKIVPAGASEAGQLYDLVYTRTTAFCLLLFNPSSSAQITSLRATVQSLHELFPTVPVELHVFVADAQKVEVEGPNGGYKAWIDQDGVLMRGYGVAQAGGVVVVRPDSVCAYPKTQSEVPSTKMTMSPPPRGPKRKMVKVKVEDVDGEVPTEGETTIATPRTNRRIPGEPEVKLEEEAVGSVVREETVGPIKREETVELFHVQIKQEDGRGKIDFEEIRKKLKEEETDVGSQERFSKDVLQKKFQENLPAGPGQHGLITHDIETDLLANNQQTDAEFHVFTNLTAHKSQFKSIYCGIYRSGERAEITWQQVLMLPDRIHKLWVKCLTEKAWGIERKVAAGLPADAGEKDVLKALQKGKLPIWFTVVEYVRFDKDLHRRLKAMKREMEGGEEEAEEEGEEEGEEAEGGIKEERERGREQISQDGPDIQFYVDGVAVN